MKLVLLWLSSSFNSSRGPCHQCSPTSTLFLVMLHAPLQSTTCLCSQASFMSLTQYLINTCYIKVVDSTRCHTPQVVLQCHTWSCRCPHQKFCLAISNFNQNLAQSGCSGNRSGYCLWKELYWMPFISFWYLRHLLYFLFISLCLFYNFTCTMCYLLRIVFLT